MCYIKNKLESKFYNYYNEITPFLEKQFIVKEFTNSIMTLSNKYCTNFNNMQLFIVSLSISFDILKNIARANVTNSLCGIVMYNGQHFHNIAQQKY